MKYFVNKNLPEKKYLALVHFWSLFLEWELGLGYELIVSGLLGFCQKRKKGKHGYGNKPGQKNQCHKTDQVVPAGKEGFTALPLAEGQESPQQYDHQRPSQNETF
jgi:hypothetical protein